MVKDCFQDRLRTLDFEHGGGQVNFYNTGLMGFAVALAPGPGCGLYEVYGYPAEVEGFGKRIVKIEMEFVK